MRKRTLGLISVLAGLVALTVASFLSWTPAEYALWPGLLLSSLFWPEGIHTGDGGGGSATAFVLFSWIGAWLFWSAAFFIAGVFIRKARTA